MATAKENEKKILAFFRDVWSEGNMEVVDQILSPDFNFILAFAHLKDRESFKKLVQANRRIFENLTYHVDDDEGDVVATEDKGAGCWRMTSRHVDTWRNVPASNKDVEIKGISFFKFSPDGLMTEARVQNDVMGLMRQIDGIKVLYDF
ncbi:MAG: ester cyclase [Bacteroidetes bacterium]|nr:ester cyclase [Bacteroidota bacterium]